MAPITMATTSKCLSVRTCKTFKHFPMFFQTGAFRPGASRFRAEFSTPMIPCWGTLWTSWSLSGTVTAKKREKERKAFGVCGNKNISEHLLAQQLERLGVLRIKFWGWFGAAAGNLEPHFPRFHKKFQVPEGSTFHIVNLDEVPGSSKVSGSK